MADNVSITPGSGKVVATDETGAGEHMQVMKLAISADGDRTLIPADTANGLDVDATRLPGNLAGKADDAAHASGDVGLMPLAVRNDTGAVLADTTLDYVPLTTDSVGGLRTAPQAKAADNLIQPTKQAAAALVPAWHDQNGAYIMRGGFRTSYTADYRLTGRPYGLSFVFGGAAVKQFATIYHLVASTKTVRIWQVVLYVKSSSAAADYLFEIRRLSATTAPATGNPAITPITHNTNSPAAEAACLALPTTAGSEAGANQGWGTQELPMGVTGAASVINPPPVQAPIYLWNALVGAGEVEPLIMRAGVQEGYAVMVDSSAAATFVCTIAITFSEE